jgi:hypothetical protein
MKNKVGDLTTHWGGRPPIEEVGGGVTTPEPFGVAGATHEAPMGWLATP